MEWVPETGKESGKAAIHTKLFIFTHFFIVSLYVTRFE